MRHSDKLYENKTENKTENKLFAMLFFAIIGIAVFAASAHAATTTLSDNGVTGLQISLVSQDPDPAVAGNTVDLRLGIANSGGKDVSNVKVQVNPSYPFDVVQGISTSQTIDVVQAYQGQNNDLKVLTFKLLINDNTPPGTYDLSVTYTIPDSALVVTQDIPVDITSNTNAEIIHIDKTVLIPGQQTPLKFVINNVGNAPLTDLTFSWSEADNIVLPVGSDNTRYIAYIGLNSSAEVDYQVIADTNAQAGLYPLNLRLTYHNLINNSDTTLSTIAGVYVGGTTDFDVAYSETSGGQTSFTIANIGSNPANSVAVSIPRQASWTVSGSNTMIIGNLNTGDYTVASFAVQSNSFSGNRTRGNFTGVYNPRAGETGNSTDGTAGGIAVSSPNTIDVQIAYTDTMGNRQIIDKQVPMNTISQSGNYTGTASATGFRSGSFTRTAQQSTFSKYMWYIIGFIVLVAAVIVLARHRRNRLINPKAKLIDVFKSPEKGRK